MVCTEVRAVNSAEARASFFCAEAGWAWRNAQHAVKTKAGIIGLSNLIAQGPSGVPGRTGLVRLGRIVGTGAALGGQIVLLVVLFRRRRPIRELRAIPLREVLELDLALDPVRLAARDVRHVF